MFNALQYTKSLEESGFERSQAEVLVRMFMQMIEFNMLSKTDFDKYGLESSAELAKFKADFERFRSEVNAEFEKFRSEVNAEFRDVRLEMRTEFQNVRSEMATEFQNARSEIKDLRLEMDHRFECIDEKLDKFALQLTIKLGIMLVLSVGLLSTILAIKL